MLISIETVIFFNKTLKNTFKNCNVHIFNDFYDWERTAITPEAYKKFIMIRQMANQLQLVVAVTIHI